MRIALQMAGYGLGPRHLKQFHTAVVRAAGLIDGVVAPALRSRNADRRDAGLDDLRDARSARGRPHRADPRP